MNDPELLRKIVVNFSNNDIYQLPFTFEVGKTVSFNCGNGKYVDVEVINIVKKNVYEIILSNQYVLNVAINMCIKEEK